MSSISEDSDDLPKIPSETSRGSSVSSGLQEEYQELLKYAIVTPKWEPLLGGKQSDTLPQLRLNEPEHQPLTTIDEYSAGSSSTRTDNDSAMGSEEPDTARRQAEAAWQLNAPESQAHIPRPMASPGRTPYRGAVLSPTPSSGSDLQVNRDPGPISYLQQTNATSEASQPGTDPDVARMNAQLDQWHGKLKMMVLAELSQVKASMSESHRREIHKLKQEHKADVDKLQDEIGQLKELLHTYEVSVERKDQVISNLTRAVQTGHDRLEMSKRLMQWKLRMMNEKRQTFTSHLARKHRERALAIKAWQGWRSNIEYKWKEKVEKACQKKAQEVCVQLTNDYEAKIASLNEALDSARVEVNILHQEREKYEETMKKAFMRGVCALNLEAMSMFQGDENQPGPNEVQTLAAAVDALTCASDGTTPQYSSMKEKEMIMKPDYLPPESRATRPVLDPTVNSVQFRKSATSIRPGSGPTTQGAFLPGQAIPKRQTGAKYPVNRSRTLSAKISGVTTSGTRRGRTQSPANKFGPPPTGVLVERHHPNIQNYQTEQTLSHAVKYPSSPTRRIAPQQMPLPHDAFTRLQSHGVKGKK